ncbi:MAG: N-acetylmuramic acid 6-phosphate etherase [Bacteroidota bacterium]
MFIYNQPFLTLLEKKQFISDTESASKHQNLEEKTVFELLTGINDEDATVAAAVQRAIPQIENFIKALVPNIKKGGRLIYIGAGTSGRLGILDASECPPTYGVSPDMVVALIAGGDKAIRHAVENAEDDPNQAWRDLEAIGISEKDTLVGIAASGTTPYVIGGLKKAKEQGLTTACIVCNGNTPLASVAQYPIEVLVGAEFVTGSTRMKSGTAQKMVLNMISTTLMIQLGRVQGNKMVDMQLSNQKLVQRGVKMLMEELDMDAEVAEELLRKKGSVRRVLETRKGMLSS